MAFRQPTYHAPPRIYATPESTSSQAVVSPQPQPLEESQEWILFAPGTASTTDRTYTTSTARTRTVGRSRISDFGSLDTAARSYDYDASERDTEGAIEEEDEGEEDGELDSLDSHLHEFRTEPSVYRDGNENSGTVLPTHDGLGSFRVDQTAMGPEVQEHLYAFERFNPRRVKRRRESIELGMLELENERAVEAERVRRVELWRMEQSRALAEEIQKETRRRKQSMSSERRSLKEEREQEDVATLSNVESSHDEEEGDVPTEENESFWNRITRRVIRDLMGIDDDLLSILFGENLPEDDDLSTTPPASRPFDTMGSIIPTSRYDQSSWEYRLLERIARELGILVNQISDHPAAFSTYLHSQQTPLPYAGLPVIPESARDIPLSSIPIHQDLTDALSPSETPQFLPTLQAQPQSTETQTHPIPIPTTSTSFNPLIPSSATPTPRTTAPILTREEWERDLDIKMVFRYLRSRFTSKLRALSPLSPPTNTSNFNSNLINPNPLLFQSTTNTTTASKSPAETAARAARVQLYHPLVTTSFTTTTTTAHQQRHTARLERERLRAVERRTWRATVPGGGGITVGGVGGGGIAHVRRGSSSCASERARRAGVGVGSGSSRHYWDWGAGRSGSLGSVVSAGGGGGGVGGGMGSWGEV